MGQLLTSFGAFIQNATGAAFASDPLAACTGDSLSIPNYHEGSRGYMEEIYSGNSAHKMEIAFFGNRFGDPTRGLRLQHQFNPTLSGADGEPNRLLPRNIDIPVYKGDLLSIQSLCTAADNVNVVCQMYYENMDGVDQRLARWSSIQARIAKWLAVEVTVTPGATGNYGTAVALNANDDRLVGDYDYALVGYTTDQPVLSIGIKGPDTGNYRIAMPGFWDAQKSSGYFVDQDLLRSTPHVPIINALNKANTFLDGLSSANAGATKVSLIVGQLDTAFFG
jgi:hypothetical protein